MPDKLSSKTFEECFDVIEHEIQKRRHKWTLKAVCWMDYDDVAQIIRIHIHKKWHLYDQARPLAPWVNTIISAQINNLLRNMYFNYVSPCQRCAANEGEGLCSIYGTQGSACPLYAKWMESKKFAHDVKLPVTIENHTQEVNDQSSESINIFKVKEDLKHKLEAVLKPNELKIFNHLYILEKSEDDLPKLLGFKTTESNRKPGYKQIKNIKNKIIQKAKEIIYNQEIDFS